MASELNDNEKRAGIETQANPQVQPSVKQVQTEMNPKFQPLVNEVETPTNPQLQSFDNQRQPLDNPQDCCKAELYAKVAKVVVLTLLAYGTPLWIFLTDAPFQTEQQSIVGSFAFFFLAAATLFCMLESMEVCGTSIGLWVQANVSFFFTLFYIASTKANAGLPERAARNYC